ncbi:MAG: hypothetical protein R3C54_05760 [Parvularculaceae bacterium]
MIPNTNRRELLDLLSDTLIIIPSEDGLFGIFDQERIRIEMQRVNLSEVPLPGCQLGFFSPGFHFCSIAAGIHTISIRTNESALIESVSSRKRFADARQNRRPVFD